MPAFEDTGLRVVVVSDIDALPADVGEAPNDRPHALRVDSYDHDWRTYHDLGMVVRPTWIHWVCPAIDGSPGMLARQSPSQRSRSRGALRAVGAMAMEAYDPIDAATFGEWARLYTAQVKKMRLGRNLATIFRESLLAPDSQHGLIVWRRDGRLVCGCVVEFDPERSALIVRFSATAPDDRASELPRGMYMALADMAAERGLRWITAGNDVNFYGAMVRPGLCAFKLRLGFLPVPGDLFGQVVSRSVAERVTCLVGLERPVLRFEYRRERRPGAVIEDFVDGPESLGLVSVTSSGERNEVLESLPEHRRIVLSD